MPRVKSPLCPGMLLVGFDSAWTEIHSGGIVGIIYRTDGSCRDLGPPVIADFRKAEALILNWQSEQSPTATIVLLDQPTIVRNATGQRPVENLVCSSVSLRYGGMQPSNTTKSTMFGKEAPMWKFLRRFGGAADPTTQVTNTRVFETYPVLAMIALCWTITDQRHTGRLPKYNPDRKSFAISDWRHVCALTCEFFKKRKLTTIAEWVREAAEKHSPRKSDQDMLDACLCLLVALHLAERKDCLMVGNLDSGYIIVPSGDALRVELETRCHKTGREPSQWVRNFRMI